MIGKGERVIWAGGEHEFRFAIGELRALEKSCDAGVATILTRLLSTQFKVDDIIEVLRIGLQGGGMSQEEAMRTIEKAYPHANLYELCMTACGVLSMFITWKTGKGEDEAEKGEAKAPTTESPSTTDEPVGRDTSAPLQ